jgi:hypothetical protein
VREKRETIQGYFTASRKVARLGFHGSAASNGEGIWCLNFGKRSDGLLAVCRFERRKKGTGHLIYVILIFKIVLFVR